MTNQNTTRPALPSPEPTSSLCSVHESQRRQLWLSLHRSHRHTCCVWFCLVFYNFHALIMNNSKHRVLRMCCVCVLFSFILDIKFVGRTSRGHTGRRSHRIYHPPFFCGARLNFSRGRIQPSLSLVDRCCCCLHIESRSDLYSSLFNIRTGPTDADALRGHRLTTQKGHTL